MGKLSMKLDLKQVAEALVSDVTTATANANNESTLRHNIEISLNNRCKDLDIKMLSFQFDLTLHTPNAHNPRFVDVAHGAVVIEYEPPNSFGGREGANLQHAQNQAAEYALLLHHEEGRSLEEYVLIAWDGRHICFGRYHDTTAAWGRLERFNIAAASRILLNLTDNGIPLVNPQLLSAIVGPESVLGAELIPKFFQAILDATDIRTNKTNLLFTEWRRLFGQVVGIQSEHLQNLLDRQGDAHHQPYSENPAAYLFALNTYIALVAKLVAALSIPNSSQDLKDANVPIEIRISKLESGTLFADAGVLNMLVGDFFTWYRDDPSWNNYAHSIETLITHLSTINYDITKKSRESTRDLFKGIYQSFVPRALRHALGEYYTPDWLASHALDLINWSPEDSLLDPTSGSGTFILEALRRRISCPTYADKSASELLSGLYGIDLNPLAVLAARASIVVFLSPYLDPSNPIRLPIFLADAINPACAEDSIYHHRLQTELGTMSFAVPKHLVEDDAFFEVFKRIQDLVDANYQAERIFSQLIKEFDISYLTKLECRKLEETIGTLVNLHKRGWDSIWSAILADRFAAGAIPPVKYISGNPPWVKWSHLPREYAEFIKDRCIELGVFSQDRWVGGIESDISTVITYESIDKYLAPRGKLAFFITGTVFSNESSQGFRRFRLQNSPLTFKVLAVEDFNEIAPFEGVSNYATLLILNRDMETEYPVPYRIWEPLVIDGTVKRVFNSSEEFRMMSIYKDLLAAPVPGTDAGPWLKGSSEEHNTWQRIFGPESPIYVARKGVTADRNGIFFVEVLSLTDEEEHCVIQNDPTIGRISGIPLIRAIVEANHVFPLLRGRGVKAFCAIPDPTYRILVPQREMHGDPDLAVSAPRTFQFLSQFRSILEQRSSYRRFQKGKPYWSLWSTGKYTFSEFKVVWKEMSGGRFVAAYIGSYHDPLLGRKLVIPDHKLYFVPINTEFEAAYLTAILNAPTISRAISAYAAQLSLGVSVVEYLNLPLFDSSNTIHRRLAELAMIITHSGRGPTGEEIQEIDLLANNLWSQ
jgi:hypothetical protein